MNKPDKNFRMNKSTKRMLALTKFKTEDQRSSFKRLMIDAQLESEKQPQRDKAEKK